MLHQKFINNNSETDGKNNLYSYCIEYGFHKFATSDEEASDLLKSLNYLQNFVIEFFEVEKKYQK